VHPSQPEVLPIVATLEQVSQPIGRVLVMWQDEDGLVRYSVEAQDGSTTLAGRGATETPSVRAASSEPSVLAPAIAALAGGGEGAADLLIAWGISTIVVAPGSPELESHLQRSPELALIGASDLGRSWRVKTEGGIPVARAWVETTLGDRVPLDSTPVGFTVPLEASASGRIILAVPADDRWSATLDGNQLPVAEADGRQAFLLNRGGGSLSVAYRDATYRAWWWAGVVSLVWASAGAIPLHDRRFRRPAP
jgi:hypothetical protein